MNEMELRNPIWRGRVYFEAEEQTGNGTNMTIDLRQVSALRQAASGQVMVNVGGWCTLADDGQAVTARWLEARGAR